MSSKRTWSQMVMRRPQKYGVWCGLRSATDQPPSGSMRLGSCSSVWQWPSLPSLWSQCGTKQCSTAVAPLGSWRAAAAVSQRRGAAGQARATPAPECPACAGAHLQLGEPLVGERVVVRVVGVLDHPQVGPDRQEAGVVRPQGVVAVAVRLAGLGRLLEQHRPAVVAWPRAAEPFRRASLHSV